MAKNNPLKFFTLEEMEDKHIGKKGTHKRDTYEHTLKLELMGEAIKEARQYRKLTQSQLGKMVGVQKAQISKLENNFTNSRFDTILKVFNALNATIDFKFEMQPVKRN